MNQLKNSLLTHFISHRGNLSGPATSMENRPDYIDYAIRRGFDVEVDMWYKDRNLYLGHDEPEYTISYQWLNERINNLWIHAKNVKLIPYLKASSEPFNYFWHETDTLTLTSRNHIWVYPNKQPIWGSIAVMPEINNDDISLCAGICSDYIEKYKNEHTINLWN